MESTMDQNSVEGRSGEALSIFTQSIDVRRPGRSRRRATQKILSPQTEQQAKPSTERRHQRRAVVERERARAESELSRAASMAKELERQIEHAHAKVSSSHKSVLHGTRAVRGSRRKKSHVDAQSPGGDQNRTLQNDTVYAEVVQELDRVKRELRKLQREVKSAREAVSRAERDAEEMPMPTPSVAISDSRAPGSGVKHEAGEANEERVIAEIAEASDETEERVVAEIAEAGGPGKGVLTQQATWTRRAKGVIRADTSHASETTEEFASASSTDVEDEQSAALTAMAQHEEEHDDASLKVAAEAKLNSARTELASVKEEGFQFTNAIERTREEMARVVEEITRINEQEKKAGAQVRQLNAKLLRARSRLEAATSADEKAEAMLAELGSALRQVGEETEAAEKEKALTETEAQWVTEEVESVGAEVAAAERRVRRAVKELEAARVKEASATARLKAALDGAVMARASDVTSSESENMTIARFEYEYLTGRAEIVRTTAEKKVAAAEAWVEALQAGEREIAMRAEAIEKEIGEAMPTGGEAEDSSGSQQQQLAPRRKATAPASLGRTRMMSAPAARKPKPPLFDIAKKRKVRVQSSCLKVIAGKCIGHS